MFLFRLHVCCVGAGPGSEILGLHHFFPANTEWLLLDNCETWIHTAEVLLGKVLKVPFNYGIFDVANNHGLVESNLPLSPAHAFRKVCFFLVFKVVQKVKVRIHAAFNRDSFCGGMTLYYVWL